MHFADPIAKSPTKAKLQSGISISFGAFTVLLDSATSSGVADGTLADRRRVCTFDAHQTPGNSDHRMDRTSNREQMPKPVVTSGSSDRRASHLNSNSLGRAETCSRCLSLGHHRSGCYFANRCVYCFRYGHLENRCASKKQPRLIWMARPGKPISTSAQLSLS